MSPRLTAVIAAMPEEVAPLRGRLSDVLRLHIDGVVAVAGTVAEQPVALVVTGDGAGKARAGIEALLKQVAVRRLIVVGVAGALTRDLRTGALVVATRVRGAGGSYAADPALVRDALRCSGGRPATIITADRIADTPAERARLLGIFGDADGSSAAVDLESAAYARAAFQHRIPWLVLRAISDSADENLPALLNEARDEAGSVQRGRVARGLIRDPGALATLLSLRWRVGRCAHVLAAATESLVSAWSVRGVPA